MRNPIEFKECPDCKVVKPRSEYYKKLTSISFRCKICTNILSKKNAPKYIGKYTEYQNKWRREQYNTNPQYKEKVIERKEVFYKTNKETINNRRRERWANDPFCPARLCYRRKDVKNRTPSWINKKELLAIYANCPKGMEVDHIIPIKGLIDGRPVSGLHVPLNLQYLSKEMNRKKHCRISENDL